MGPSIGLPKLSRLSLFCLVSTSASTVGASALFLRQDATCGGVSGLSQCGNDFPSEFCCSKDTSCQRLNSTDAISVICCPTGADCSFIQPITCEVGQFNARLHPDNQIHISNSTDIKLPQCGTKCCPLGYSCNGNMCRADSAAPAPSSTSASTPSSTSAPSASQTTEVPPVVKTQSGFDGKSFAAGFFPGLILGALATLALLWVLKKRRESQDKERYSGDFGHVARTISDPIYDPVYAARTDFIRRGSQSAQPSPNSTTNMVKSSPSQAGGVTPKIKSLWERTPKLGFGGWGGSNLPANGLPAHPAPAVRAGHGDPYTTPTRSPARTASPSRTTSRKSHKKKRTRPQNTRSGSTETIDVLMHPPSFLAPPKAPAMRENRLTTESGQTTFTKLMERAGYEEQSRDDVRNWKPSPGNAR